jgi:coenzyme Q-binding protein COQ10
LCELAAQIRPRHAEKSRVLGMLMGAMFEAAFRRFAEAFERRADAVYGSVKTS